jgi:hypothetical protein
LLFSGQTGNRDLTFVLIVIRGTSRDTEATATPRGFANLLLCQFWKFNVIETVGSTTSVAVRNQAHIMARRLSFVAPIT